MCDCGDKKVAQWFLTHSVIAPISLKKCQNAGPLGGSIMAGHSNFKRKKETQTGKERGETSLLIFVTKKKYQSMAIA